MIAGQFETEFDSCDACGTVLSQRRDRELMNPCGVSKGRLRSVSFRIRT